MAPVKQFKVCKSVEDALRDLKSGSTVMVGGFGLAGIPENIIEYVRTQTQIKDLDVISTEAGDDEWGLGRLIETGQIRSQYASYIGRCKVFEKAYLEGKMEVHLTPQGTLAEKIRCAGAGIPAFYSIVGKDTLYGQGKLPIRFNPDGSVAAYNTPSEQRDFHGKNYLLEEAFPLVDFAWIRAYKADEAGNCVFRGTGYNFNGIMATAAKCTIVEAEQIVKVGEIKPEEVHLPGVNVHRVFQGAKFERRIEIRKTAEDEKKNKQGGDSIRDAIAKRAALEFVSGMNCNLGVGMPTLAASYAAEFGTHVTLQSENGLLGIGPYPRESEVDSEWINAGKETILPAKGASTFGSDVSFAQIRGGHLDMSVLGAFEVSQYGDVANFMIPGKMVKGMGGAMDLVAHPERTKVLIIMTHQSKNGEPKIKKECDLPLTGAKCVGTIVTELACFDVNPKTGLTLRDYNPDSSIDEIREKTGADFKVADGCKAWSIPK